MNSSDSTGGLGDQVYGELRRLAGAAMRHERAGHTLDPTALVHEAYLRLASTGVLATEDEAEFAAAAAGTVRRVLVDHARARRRLKRGGAQPSVALSPEIPESDVPTDVDTLELSELLDQLAELNPRQARVVELRFFGGLSVDDVARLLDLSDRTVKNDWRVARAWLRAHLDDGCADP